MRNSLYCLSFRISEVSIFFTDRFIFRFCDKKFRLITFHYCFIFNRESEYLKKIYIKDNDINIFVFHIIMNVAYNIINQNNVAERYALILTHTNDRFSIRIKRAFAYNFSIN